MEEDGLVNTIQKMLDSINKIFVQIDECFAEDDVNGATKKTYEGLLLIKAYKDGLK